MKVMVNFQLGKLNVKDEIMFPTGIEPMTSRTPGGSLQDLKDLCKILQDYRWRPSRIPLKILVQILKYL